MGGYSQLTMRDKPSHKSPDEFISSSKDTKTSAIDLLEFEIRKDKTFLLRIPPKLHELAKKKAEESKIPLHDYIILAIKEKVLSE